ncbi:MAG: hypothetical protein WD834_08700 [Actinomycetota bacterium]
MGLLRHVLRGGARTLFKALYFVTGNRHDAEELMQDAFLRHTTDERSGFCRASETWVWDAELLADGRLRTVATDDAAGQGCQVGLGVEWTWVRLS